MRHRLVVGLLLLAGLVASASAPAAPRPVTLDARSDASAQRSYEKMMRGRSDAQKVALALAVMQINLEGVNSAYELAADPGLKELGINRIRERVAGMTADEIIALGERVSSVRMEPATP